MNCVSVCDGISAASVAAQGLDYKFLLLSEIESFPRSVLKYRHGAIDQRQYVATATSNPILWGDFTTLRPRHLRRLLGHADVDVLFGGTPCQSYSVAGKRAGLDDPRGELSLEFALLAFRLGVRWFLWENVPGVFSSAEGKDFAAILSAFTGREVEVPQDGWQSAGVIEQASAGHFGIAWRVFDAQYAGVPQRRRRIFVVGHLGDWRRAAAVLFDLYSLQGHPAPRREKGQSVAGTFTSRAHSGGWSQDVDLASSGYMQPIGVDGSDVGFALRANASHSGDKGDGGVNCTLVASTGEVSHCLNGGGMGRQDFETETLISVGGFPDSATAYRTSGDGCIYEEGEKTAPLTTGTDKSANVVTIPIADMATRYAGTDGSGGEAGKGHGLGIGGPEDPMFTLTKGDKHAIAIDEYNGSVNGDVTHTLRDGHSTGSPRVLSSMAVRRLTPRECERLQGFPDDYTLVPHRGKPAADGPRYKALGNSWAVPCVRWILERMLFVNEIEVCADAG